MPSAVTVLDSFLSSAYALPKETGRKVFKALRNFVSNPQNSGLNLERLQGRASDLWSIRVDNDYRIIFRESRSGPPTVLFVGKHDLAYRFADRNTSHPHIPDMLFLRSAPAEDDRTTRRNEANFIMPHLDGEGHTAQIEIEDLESIVKTRKYLPIARLLLQEVASLKRFTFSELEYAIRDQLPPSARKYSAWWANERGRHVQASAWLGVGWRVDSFDLRGETVTFRRI